jgi:predicted nucleic acid-binding protein
VSRFVLDVSVVLTWCFPDENDALAARAAEMFARGDTAIVPSFWPHEVLNALLVAEKRDRISTALVRSFLNDLVKLPIVPQHVPSAAVFSDIQGLSREHDLTAYDAAYLSLAIDTNLPLATLDAALIRAIKRSGVERLL